MRYRLQRHDGTDCSATMVPITVLRMVPIQRYRHIRENTSHGIEELGLRPEQLNEALNFLPSYDLVETGYSSYREESEATFGRGNGYGQNFFWSINESGVVNAIWLDIEVAPITMDMWRKSLISLGETAPVLLADWNCSLCVDLTNSSDIEEYIKEKSRL